MRFTFAEQQKMVASLRRRFPKAKYPGLVSVGLGLPLKGGRPDPEHDLAVCFYVARKHQPKQEARRLPCEVSFRLWRRKRWHTERLRADVISLEGVRTTGAQVDVTRPSGANDFCTGGLVVEWDAAGAAHRGVLTVSHPLAAGTAVTIGPTEVGRVTAVRPPDGEFDLGVFELSAEALFFGSAGPFQAYGPNLLRLNQLGWGGLQTGVSLPPAARIGLQVSDYFDNFEFDDRGTTLFVRHVVRLYSDFDLAFGPGRSGSVLLLELTNVLGQKAFHPFAIQVAGDSTNSYRTGYGQLLCEVPSQPIVSSALTLLTQQMASSPLRVVGYC